MPTGRECVCCTEIQRVVDRMNSTATSDMESACNCITEHEDFHPVCLNVWVLQTAYFEYRQTDGTGETSSFEVHE